MSRTKQVPEGYKKISVNVRISLMIEMVQVARKLAISFTRAVERAFKLFIEENKYGK